jgi:hypothetical protein
MHHIRTLVLFGSRTVCIHEKTSINRRKGSQNLHQANIMRSKLSVQSERKSNSLRFEAQQYHIS